MRPRSPTVCYLPAGARGTLGLSSVQGPESEGGRHKSPSESKSPRARRADARGQETDVLLRQREGIPSPTYVFCSGIKRLCDPHPHWGGASPCSASDANANLSGDPLFRHTKRNVLPASELGLPWPRRVDTELTITPGRLYHPDEGHERQ